MTGDAPWLDRTQWPWRPRTCPTADGMLHYVDEGEGPPVVLVHGTPTWAFEWRHVIAGLRDTRRVVALDHLGFGLSERPAGADYRPEGHAARFATFMDHVAGDAPVSLVVHDFGGPIALAWALAHPRARAHADGHQLVDVVLRRRCGDAAASGDGGRRGGTVPVPVRQCLAAPHHAVGVRRPAPPHARHPPPVPRGVPGRRQPRTRALRARPCAARIQRVLRRPVGAA